MSRRSKRLIFSSLVISSLTLYIGCSQPEDVLKSVTNTYIYVNNIQNFPSSGSDWRYEVWAADATDTISAGKFAYSNPLKKFFNVDGSARADSNRFLLKADLLAYSKVFVSVEPYPDPDPASPSAIMLIDDATDPADNVMRLVFPEIADTIPLWSALCRFSMETVSDDSTYIKDGFLKPFINTRDTSTNGFGIWFANYSRSIDSIRDTTLGLFVDSTERKDTIGTGNDTVVVSLLKPINGRVDTIIRHIGLDSFVQYVWRYDSVLYIDSIGPEYTSYIPHFEWTTNPPLSQGPRIVAVDTFTQDNFRMPNFEPYGWKYKGWVVSPLIDTAAGHLTPPAWGRAYNDSVAGTYEIPGDYGGILTTGTFGWIDKPDDGNLYTKTNRVPAFPGDEFWFNLPDGLDSTNLVPNSSGNTGTVFITLEPMDLLNGHNKTNFPLFVMIRELPTLRSQVTADNQQFTMRNRTGYVIADRGFPSVELAIRRF